MQLYARYGIAVAGTPVRPHPGQLRSIRMQAQAFRKRAFYGTHDCNNCPMLSITYALELPFRLLQQPLALCKAEFASQTLTNILLRGMPSLHDERRPKKYSLRHKIASPNITTVPIRCATSAPRMFSKMGRPSRLDRLKPPRTVNTKNRRRDLRRFFIVLGVLRPHY